MKPHNEHAPGLGGKTLGKIAKIENAWAKAGLRKEKPKPKDKKNA